jgi:hypothetical protein
MSERLHGLVQLLPDKTSLKECSLEELHHITKRFPYFAPAQFLLLQKLKETDSPDYKAQHRKALLYFHDPLLFDYFISAGNFYMDEAVFDAVENAESLPQEQTDEKRLLAETVTEGDVSFSASEIPSSETTPVKEDRKEFQLSHATELQLTSELPPPPSVQVSSREVPPLAEPDKVKETADIEPAEPAVLPVLPLQENPQPLAVAGEPEQAQPVPPAAAIIVAPPSEVVVIKEEELWLLPQKRRRHSRQIPANR